MPFIRPLKILAAAASLATLLGCAGTRRGRIETSADSTLAATVGSGAFLEPTVAALSAVVPRSAYVRPLGGAVETRWLGDLGSCSVRANTRTVENDQLTDFSLGCHSNSAADATATLAHWLAGLHGRGLPCCTSAVPQGQEWWSCVCHSPEADPLLSIEAMVFVHDGVWVAAINLSREPILRTY